MREPSADEESRLFDRLCELEPEAQAVQLDALAQSQPALARRLRRLLSIDAEYAAHTASSALAQAAAITHAISDAIIGRAADATGAASARMDPLGHSVDGGDEEAEEGAPARDPASRGAGLEVGPFRLLRRIGRGGMGVVYLAERRLGFAQPVAVKLLPRFADDAVARARFARERRLLAQLRHPHICGILDGGELDDGTPWLAMELVEGESLCTWAARRALPLRERVALFLQLCDAVQYAHRRLVVHRDIKDGNVLVEGMLVEGMLSEDALPDGRPLDGRAGHTPGRARLLDFGIAKALGGDAADESSPEPAEALHTLADERFFSPQSAAPEQLRGERTTTAVDVYALGTLLHQLLTGSLPFADLARDRLALQRAILERVPPPASAALQRAQEAGRIAPTHPVAPRALRGDLDAIVARCLRKDPDARYADVAELARDLRAWRDGRPVSAATGDRWGDRAYRLRKFIARHRSASVLGALAVISLVFAFAATLWRSAELRAERDAAQMARAQSEIDRDRARTVAGFMRDTFEQADPGRAAEGGLLARDLIAQGLQRLDRLDAQPEVQAELALLLAESQQALGLHAESRALVRRHAARIDRLAMKDAELRWRVGRLRARDALALDADPVAAAAAIARLAAQARTPERQVELAFLRERLAIRRARFAEAAGLLEDAWRTHAAALKPDARLALRLALADALLNIRRDADAGRLLDALDRQTLSQQLPALQIRAWRTLARWQKLRLETDAVAAQGPPTPPVKAAAGTPVVARSLATKSVATKSASMDATAVEPSVEEPSVDEADPPDRVELHRAALNRTIADWLAAADRLYGPDSLETASALVWSIGAEPDPARQERLLQRAYVIQRERLPRNTLGRALAEYNVGYFWLEERDQPARAVAHLGEAVASGRAAVGRAHGDVRSFDARWAVALNRLGRHDEVLAMLDDPPAMSPQLDAADLRKLSRLRLELAAAASARAQHARARREYARIREEWRAFGQPPPAAIAAVLARALPPASAGRLQAADRR